MENKLSVMYVGSLLDSKADILCYQANWADPICDNAAPDIRSRFPYAYNVYLEHCRITKPKDNLGRVLFASTNPSMQQFVAYCFVQETIAKGEHITDYNAVRACFVEIDYMDVVSVEAHRSGDATYNGYLLYDEHEAAWFPEDLDPAFG